MGITTGAEPRVPFGDLSRSVDEMRDDIDTAMTEVLESGRFILGDQCEAFETEFAACQGYGHAVGVASGTDALELALRALEIGLGDEVITQANTCVPTIAAILRAGATPVLCDVDPESATLDVDSLASVIGPATRAVIPVHLYGQCADMAGIRSIADRHGLAVVEDCAQANGAEFRGRPAGTFGAMGCFSFYPTKNLGGLGDGGAVVTRDRALAERLRWLRQYGQATRDHYVMIGVNSRLDELQAAVLRRRLPRLEGWNKRRAQIASAYEEALDDTPVRPLLALPDRRHAFHLYVVRAPNRKEFRTRLERRGVETAVHYPKPLHAHRPYGELLRAPMSLANAERLAETVVSLPLYPGLTDEEAQTVATAARESALS